MSFFTKVLRWRRPASNPEAEAEAQLRRAEREAQRDRVRALGGPRGIGGLAPPRDDHDPRR